MEALTPMLQQYRSLKEQHSDTILMFRLGDFYEMFFEDAATASRELEIVLTSREGGNGQRIPMCGVPFHAADSYIARLVSKKYKVAICEQMESPALAKGLVRREIVRVISPGTITDTSILEDKKNNYLAAVSAGEEGFGLSASDVSTGDFRTTMFVGQEARKHLLNELARIAPRECLLDKSFPEEGELHAYLQSLGVTISSQEPITSDHAYSLLTAHFNISSLDEFGCEHMPLAVTSAGMILLYLQKTQKISLVHLKSLITYNSSAYMLIDAASRRNLELTETMRDKSRKGSLLGVLDQTVTSMGGRQLRQWIELPLLDCGEIQRRLDALQELADNFFLRRELRGLFAGVYDLERLLSRLAYGHANARDLMAMLHSIRVIPALIQLMESVQSPLLASLANGLDPLEDISALIKSVIADDPPLSIRDGGLIRPGYHAQVDQLREASASGKEWIAQLETKERELTGIKSLRVGYNKVFGYFMEVTRPNLAQVPDRYIRRQTLANAERFITPELKQLEDQVFGASERLAQLEYELFISVRDEVGGATARIQRVADIIAQLDTLASLAECAVRHGYSRPKVDASDMVFIKAGRHPVVECVLNGQWFVPNDCYLGGTDQTLMIITGPNMAGKSTYMRQVALIVLMAQIGSFVPAEKAEIGVVDRVFTRVGAMDDLATGQSTFMVEMLETATILGHATNRSLVVLDEIGRGTSTYDGMSIAQAVIEYIQTRIRAKTLFSTHYHELTDLEGKVPGVKNYTVAVKEQGADVIFLRQVVPGKADRSYGINVARLSELPEEVIHRANQILARLEAGSKEIAATSDDDQMNMVQLNLFPQVSVAAQEVLEELRRLDVISTTPLEAINLLYRFQRRILS